MHFGSSVLGSGAPSPSSLDFLICVLAGWVNDRQRLAVEYLGEERRALRHQLGKKR